MRTHTPIHTHIFTFLEVLCKKKKNATMIYVMSMFFIVCIVIVLVIITDFSCVIIRGWNVSAKGLSFIL